MAYIQNFKFHNNIFAKLHLNGRICTPFVVLWELIMPEVEPIRALDGMHIFQYDHRLNTLTT